MGTKSYKCDCDAIHEDKVAHTRKNIRSEGEIARVAEFFKVLGDNTRMHIMCSLAIDELCVCDLSVILNMTKSAVSHQLSRLKEEHQVKCRRDGKNIYYSLQDDHVKDILEQAFAHVGHEAGKGDEDE